MTLDSPSFDIRYSTLWDAPFLRSWLESPGMLHFFPLSEKTEVDGVVHSWVSYHKYKASLTATWEEAPCGMATLFLSPYKKVAHHSFFKIIVDPKYQGKGVGSALIKNIKHLAKTYFHLDMVHIEVVEGNPLEALLKKQGFIEFMRQEKYFKEGDAYYARVLYKCYLSEGGT